MVFHRKGQMIAWLLLAACPFSAPAAAADALAGGLWRDIDPAECPLRSPLRVADGASTSGYLSLQACGARIIVPPRTPIGATAEVARISGVTPGAASHGRQRRAAATGPSADAPAGGSFARPIAAAARGHRIDPLFLQAMIGTELDGDPMAVSAAGARGLMQILPATAARFRVPANSLFDPAVNIETGARLLKALQRRFGNDRELVLAAYNAGEGAVAAHRGIPPFPETRAYVARVLERYARSRAGTGF